jgi:hypothetical protein
MVEAFREASTSMPSEKVPSVLSHVQYILPQLEELESLSHTLDLQSDKSTSELSMIFEDQDLTDYYQTVRKIQYQFLAAQVLVSGRVQVADDFTDMMISGASALGSCLPGVGLLVTACTLGASVKHG